MSPNDQRECSIFILLFLRFQNRRAKEKRLNKDPSRRWSNEKNVQEMKSSRMKTRKVHDDESSTEGDTAISYDGKIHCALIFIGFHFVSIRSLRS